MIRFPPVTWAQNYDPLGAWPLSTFVSSLPVLTLFFVLVVLRKRVWIAAFSGFAVALTLALAVFHLPVQMAGGACALGAIFGFLRIAWVIVGSIFLYHVAVDSGQFQVMKESIAALSSDRRLQVILIAFCFGAFLEGTGGGGAPVAIAGSFLIGLGFPPFQAATLCLLANTAPVAWGSAGNPIHALGGVTGLPEPAMGAMIGRLLPPISLILPLWLVRSMTSWKETREVWPALAVSGASFAAMQFYWSNFQENGLVDIVAALFSLLSMVVFLKIWRPADGVAKHRPVAVLKGWSPFLFASLGILAVSLPVLTRHLTFDSLKVPMPGLHNLVMRVPPVAPQPTPEPAIADLNFLALPGTAILMAAIVAGLLLGLPAKKLAQIFARTLRQLGPSLAAITFMLALAFVTRYSGMDTVLGLSLTRTGAAYPFFGTLLGWLGVALTGTDAGSNALFGNLQKVTAEQLGLSPILMCAANSAGGVMGKMIDAQSIVVASAATEQDGNEAAIFRAVIKHSIALAVLVSVLVTLYAFVFPAWIPR